VVRAGFLRSEAQGKGRGGMNPRLRCAIYTRKSSEEGLEQSFNSLDAQREACEAFVKSQKHEGWQLIATHYDDGGFSGGNMDRPALKQLMADIQAGKVSVVVVYKVDRLTRSLTDFAKLVEQFDKFGVSFVSVTQQFNTTTSMGRLTLNVLLSFAQFEREVTGERIRDKIAASKKKGMWMGGTVPLGYTAQDRKLIVNEPEAVTVRTIFNDYTSQAVNKKTEKSNAPARIPAPDVENAVVDCLLNWLQTPADLLAALRDETTVAPEGFFDRIIAQAAVAAQSCVRIAADRTQFLKTVIDRVVIHPVHVEVRLRVPALVNAILGGDQPGRGFPPFASVECPFRHVQQGRALRLIVGNTSITTDASRQAILKAIARARRWYEQITTGKATNIAQLAGIDGVSPRFIRMQMKLVQLSPQSIENLMTRPESLPLSLNDLLTSIPTDWRKQSLGMPAKSA
jgi:DNA invertase Pin-like site-specific DNA recombinase